MKESKDRKNWSLSKQFLEKAAEQLKPSAPIKFQISSRTDSGVHALANAAHLDVQRAAGRAPFTGQQLLQGLNRHLRPEPIRILSAQRVPSTFHARFCALSRTYIYRLLLGCAHPSQVPVFERDLCWAPPGGPLDIAAMQAAAQLLQGTHDFSTFRSPQAEAQGAVRTLQQLQLQPAPGLLGQHGLHGGLQFWEVRAKSRSFLYRQVRRMVGALVAVGQGRLGPAELQELLQLRDPRALPPHATAPARGLFLHSVEYSPKALPAEMILQSSSSPALRGELGSSSCKEGNPNLNILLLPAQRRGPVLQLSCQNHPAARQGLLIPFREITSGTAAGLSPMGWDCSSSPDSGFFFLYYCIWIFYLFLVKNCYSYSHIFAPEPFNPKIIIIQREGVGIFHFRAGSCLPQQTPPSKPRQISRAVAGEMFHFLDGFVPLPLNFPSP